VPLKTFSSLRNEHKSLHLGKIKKVLFFANLNLSKTNPFNENYLTLQIDKNSDK
jgi:hypothetical protein